MEVQASLWVSKMDSKMLIYLKMSFCGESSNVEIGFMNVRKYMYKEDIFGDIENHRTDSVE